MARSASQNAGGALLFGALVIWGLSSGSRNEPPRRKPLPSDTWQTLPGDFTEADVEALARMLSSETSDARARVVLGWITVRFARRAKLSVFRLLTGKSGQYGHQKYFYPDGRKETRYASTFEPASPKTRELARQLLANDLPPPEIVQRTKPSAYVQLGPASKQLGPDGEPLQPAYDDARILAKQKDYGGVVGRLSNWFLYAKGAPPITSVDEAALV